MTHLLIAAHEFPPGVGGASRLADTIAQRLASEGVRVTVLTSQRPSAGEHDVAYERRVVSIPRSTGLAHLVWRGRIAQALRDGQPEMLLATDIMTQRACALLPRHLRGRCAVMAHGTEILANFAEGWPKRQLYTRLYRDAPVTLANSRYTRQLLIQRGIDAQKIHLLHPWLDPIWWQRPAHPERVRGRHGLQAHQRVILTVGQLSSRKGQAAVIRALPAIRRVVPGAVYLLVGVGDQAPYQRLARQCGVAAAVIWAGIVSHRDELMDYYDACDLFVMPSRQVGSLVEGFGIAFLEAQARGKPVVGGRSGGISEALQDGVTGRLVDGERSNELSDVICALLTDRACAERMGAAGRLWVSQTFHPKTATRLSDMLLNGAIPAQRHR